MAQVIDLIRNLSKKHRERLDKSKKIAEKMVKNADAAAKAVQKK